MADTQESDALKKDAIIIDEYDQNWSILAKQEIKKIFAVISDGNFVDIQHIGSTSIAKAMAKPIIDLYMDVKSIRIAKQRYIKLITSLGYVYWEENPNPN